MKNKTAYLAVSGMILLAACGANSASYEEKAKADATPMDITANYESMPASDSTAVQYDVKDEERTGNNKADPSKYVSSSAAVVDKSDTVHKFIRTADLKFKVKDVINTTYRIEDIVASFKGFVTYTKLNSTIDSRSVLPVSADSSLETTYFTVENTMVIRVPNTELDTTLKRIAKLIDFMDYRVIKAQDVRLNLLSNQLTQSRVNRHETRLEKAIDERGKKLHETSEAENTLLARQEQSDAAKIRNMELQDQIDYSTINIEMYQRQDVTRELIANYKNIEVYEPGFGSKLWESLKFGWNIVEATFLFLVKIWSLILLILILFFMFRKYMERFKK